MSEVDVAQAAMTIEALLGVSSTLVRLRVGKERQAEKERMKRFLALPPELQEGILRYGENIRQAYQK